MNPERWQQIERIYNRALELDTSQRAAFIQEACAGDASLRKEVERLTTAGHTRIERARAFLDATTLSNDCGYVFEENVCVTWH